MQLERVIVLRGHKLVEIYPNKEGTTTQSADKSFFPFLLIKVFFLSMCDKSRKWFIEKRFCCSLKKLSRLSFFAQTAEKNSIVCYLQIFPLLKKLASGIFKMLSLRTKLFKYLRLFKLLAKNFSSKSRLAFSFYLLCSRIMISLNFLEKFALLDPINIFYAKGYRHFLPDEFVPNILELTLALKGHKICYCS